MKFKYFASVVLLYLLECLLQIQIGRVIMAAAASSNLKRVSLELGGKSPLVVFADMNGRCWQMNQREAKLDLSVLLLC